MKKVYTGSILVVILLLTFFGCGGGGGSTTDTGVSGTIKTAQYSVVSSETVQVSGDLIIESNSTIVIDGDIVAQGDAGQNITLKAVGDINISGDVIAGSGDANKREGGSVTLISETGNISIFSDSHLQAGDGQNGENFSASAPLLRAVNGNYQGATGGSVILKASIGVVALAKNVEIFHIGNGGDGTDISINGDDLINTQILEDYNNDGGNSGTMEINATSVVGFVNLEELSGGDGGDGGDVVIATDENNMSTWPSESQAVKLRLPTVYEGNLEDMRVSGGAGGLAFRIAGDGGGAKYTGKNASTPGANGQNVEAHGGPAGNAGEDNNEDQGNTLATWFVGGNFLGLDRSGRGGIAWAKGGNGAVGAPGQNGGNGGNAEAYGGEGGFGKDDGKSFAFGGHGGTGGDACNIENGYGGAGGDGGAASAILEFDWWHDGIKEVIAVNGDAYCEAKTGNAGDGGDATQKPGLSGLVKDPFVQTDGASLKKRGEPGVAGVLCLCTCSSEGSNNSLSSSSSSVTSSSEEASSSSSESSSTSSEPTNYCVPEGPAYYSGTVTTSDAKTIQIHMYNLVFGTESNGKIPASGSIWIDGSGIGDPNATDFTKDKFWFTTESAKAYIDTATGKLVINLPDGGTLNASLGKVANGDCYLGGSIGMDGNLDSFSMYSFSITSYDPPLSYDNPPQ